MNDENTVLDEELEEENSANDIPNDELRAAIEEQMNKLRLQAMLLGAQVSAKTILDKIIAFENKPGKKTCNDYKRLVKDVKDFCAKGLSRKVNHDGTTTPVEESTDETVQN